MILDELLQLLPTCSCHWTFSEAWHWRWRRSLLVRGRLPLAALLLRQSLEPHHWSLAVLLDTCHIHGLHFQHSVCETTILRIMGFLLSCPPVSKIFFQQQTLVCKCTSSPRILDRYLLLLRWHKNNLFGFWAPFRMPIAFLVRRMSAPSSSKTVEIDRDRMTKDCLQTVTSSASAGSCFSVLIHDGECWPRQIWQWLQTYMNKS